MRPPCRPIPGVFTRRGVGKLAASAVGEDFPAIDHGNTLAAPTIGDDHIVRHKHMLRAIPKSPWLCQSVRSKVGQFSYGHRLLSHLTDSDAAVPRTPRGPDFRAAFIPPRGAPWFAAWGHREGGWLWRADLPPVVCPRARRQAGLEGGGLPEQVALAGAVDQGV